MPKYKKIIEGMSIVDIANSEDGYNYYGYIRTNGEWAILRAKTDNTEFRIKVGSSGYEAAFTARASHTYKIPTIG